MKTERGYIVRVLTGCILLSVLFFGCSDAILDQKPISYTIASGELQNYAIDSDGALWFWGIKLNGQTQAGVEYTVYSEPQKIMDKASSVRIGETFAMILADNGVLWGLGNLPDAAGSSNSELRVFQENVITIDARGFRLMAVDKDFNLWDWGTANNNMKAGQGDEPAPTLLLDQVRSVSTSYTHTMAIRKDDTLWLWGHNEFGQLGNGTTEYSATPIKVLENAALVSAGDNISAAILSDHSLWVWGKYMGEAVIEPVQIAEDVIFVAAGSLFDQSSVMFITGDNALWVLGYNLITDQVETAAYKIMENVEQVDLCSTHVLAETTDGILYGWGDYDFSRWNDQDSDYQTKPVIIPFK